jgi:hypothetical protein
MAEPAFVERAPEEAIASQSGHDVEQIRRQRIIHDGKAQTAIRRSDERAARRSQFDDAGAVASSHAWPERRWSESFTAEEETSQN